MQLMLKNPNDLTNGEKELLSYVEKVLSKDEYAELKEQAIKGNNGQGIADNLKLKFGDTRYGPLLELANNDGFLKSIKKAGEDFIIGAGNSLDKNIFGGTAFTVGGINQSSMLKSIPYKIGELAGDIGSFAFGAAEAGTGAGGELLGFTADGTVVLAPAGAALNIASLGLVTHGGAATIKSAHNFSEDLFSLIKGEGNKGAAEVEKAISRIDEVEVNFNYKTKYDEAEFARQLADQEAGMNKLTVDEYLKNRERYIAEGRAIEGNMAQQAARKEALANKIDELLDSGMSYQEAERHANKWLESQAALHNPDQVAGGNSLNIGGMGDKTINSSIGVQWKYRIDAVDEQIQQMAKNMTDIEKESTYLNVKLKY
ncbi:polymorphic toxin type 15 domain-containing protein [Clostridium kluyveri]|nr:polymorphic toxin type 15 domain-containing protein [Clostridium kluyveri]UZQ52269.1 polymorphic toxin type 15 domain-containing protein [Clostridium kluyveri]